MSQSNRQMSRRTLFAGAATAGSLAAAASLLPAARQAAEPTAPSLPEPPARGGGYQLTDHVRRYFKTTRL